ncbi:anaphase promoting complex subunit 1 [Sugiyamaella lignohabitans]|uniref:Anaphase promoting complex subunit 1 n=1 Tax=Sugiyamaella lignohabitans TaxID=796027 RepID=A0A167CVE3_9ASCO|nr:anaphase promoting complex subunit 1 [Sugiyamaella lignohabitans]ANB12150.1 anaphase promoting complex subunit 1 [Sugiyamaella lignohabitans]
MIDLFSSMNEPEATVSSVLKHILELGLRHSDLDSYPEGVRIPILEIIACLKDDINSQGDVNTFMLLQRNDLLSTLNGLEKPVSYHSTKETQPQEIKTITQNVGEHEGIGAWDGQSEADRIAISRLIFSEDKRFYEVSKLLQSSRGHTATLVQPPDSNENDWLAKQQALFKATALRTYAIPFGRAALFYSSRRPLATEKYLIPRLNFNVVIRPSNVTILTPKSFLQEENLAWAHFHNGVSAGLSISTEYNHISGSWIVFNRPPSLNSQHAGFLLGLGLNGHLTKLKEWHIYNYLGPKHIPTSIALLIGMAASQMGSCDIKLTKVLSVHVAALLPMGSSDLNVSTLVQSSGLIGVGLLYCNSQHRRMSEILLSEVDTSAITQQSVEKDEGYCLAAGISLGFINIGKGNDLKGLSDVQAVERLLEMAVKTSDIQRTQNFDRSVPGALMALLFMFLKTNNKSVAEKISIPETEQRLTYIRPDFILLRTLTKSLILWDSIGQDKNWVDSAIPKILVKSNLEDISHLDGDQMVYYNMIAGLCLAMGLKYVSTADTQAKETLIWYFDQFIRLSGLSAHSKHDGLVTRQCLMNCQGVVSLALASVMAGTGDLDVLRRLRRQYGRVSKEVTFGSNMANEMAMGLLFLGGGQYSLSNSNLAIACLVVSFYPLLPTHLVDSRSHLQALRHFWVLAAEPRCLVVRNDTSKAPVSIDVVIRLKNHQIVHRKAPCLLPPLDEIMAISTNNSKYFQVNIDLTDENSPLAKAFINSRTLFVRDKMVTNSGNSSNFSATLEALIGNPHGVKASKGMNQLLSNLSSVSTLDKLQKNVLVSTEPIDDKLRSTAVDLKLTLESMAKSPLSVDDLWNLRLLFAFDDKWAGDSDVKILSKSVIDDVKLLLWKTREAISTK